MSVKQNTAKQNTKEFIESKGGKVVGFSVAPGTHHYLLVDYTCKNNHQRSNIQANEIKKSWCPECLKNTIEDARALAHKREGKFLSPVYINSNTKYSWECANGHKFEMRYSNVLNGRWCRQCHCRSIEEMQELAESHGGKCLSTVYLVGEKLQWQCEAGHIWEAFANGPVSGTWCPECSKYTRERLCRKILEFIYNVPFPKKRPDWLLSRNQTRLELDGYCEELSIAFEHQGRQHYEEIAFFYVTGAEFEQLQQRDQDKKAVCVEHNAQLIIIPYTVNLPDLYVYMRALCPNLPPNTPETISLEQLDLHGFGADMLKSIQIHLDTQYPGSKVISTVYLNWTMEMEFVCAVDHVFKRSWGSITYGTFCTICSRNVRKRKFFDTKVLEFCKKAKISPLTEYIHTNTLMTWKCDECNHVFEKNWTTLSQGGFVCTCYRAISVE